MTTLVPVNAPWACSKCGVYHLGPATLLCYGIDEEGAYFTLICDSCIDVENRALLRLFHQRRKKK